VISRLILAPVEEEDEEVYLCNSLFMLLSYPENTLATE